MAIKIAVTNAKGGVAKSTTAINIADALMYIGYKVLFIDLDPQANSTSVYRGTITREAKEKTLFDLFEGKSKIKSCIQHTEFGDIVAGDARLSTLDSVYLTKVGGVKILKKALKDIENDYDFIIMDTPPNVGSFMRNAIYSATGVIVPVTPKKFAMDGLNTLIDTVNEIKEDGNENLKIYGIVLTMYDKRYAQDREILKELPALGEALAIHIFKKPIRLSQKIETSLSECKSLFRTAGSSNGANDYVELVKELLSKIEAE